MRFVGVLLAVGAGMAALGACDGDDDGIAPAEGGAGSPSASSSSSSGQTSSGGSSSGGASSSGGSSSGGSSSSSGSSGVVDAGNVGQECVFTGNYGCDPGLRCECEDEVNCTCQPGTRGAGAYNAPCTDGNQCESALCIGGPLPDGGLPDAGSRSHFCSKACTTQDECGVAPLSRCESQLTGVCIAP